MASGVRRVTDATVASIVLVLLAPLCLAIAAAILLEGGGGVVFTQTRVGRGGRRFRILKFRTMRPAGGGRPGDVPLRQRRGDPRCTRVGRVLRRTHLYELIRFDRGYLTARSLRRDLSVLARTVVCVARGAGR
jgi:lipopolysaccharide/colanic/teichoic acid biosynthesis glycosyltransferase